MTDESAGAAPALIADRYRVDGPLGEGAFGAVVRAFDTLLKRPVAIKTLKRALATEDRDLLRTLTDRFTREAEAGSRMGIHPNLVAVYDLETDAARNQYLILEFVPGGTLDSRIAKGPLSLADSLRLTADIARGLQAAHDVGIVHRDLKPANVFIAADGRAQVGDFGIAQIDHLSGRTYALVTHPGTPLYMSPEQERGPGYLHPTSDQYSLGLILFEMLTGSAYRRLLPRAVEERLVTLPPTVAAVIRQLVREMPDDRYIAMTDVMRAALALARTFTDIEEADKAADAPRFGDGERGIVDRTPGTAPAPPGAAPLRRLASVLARRHGS
jgi:serine/threonine protein kinase